MRHSKLQVWFEGKERVHFRLLLSLLILYFSKYGNQTLSDDLGKLGFLKDNSCLFLVLSVSFVLGSHS